jgi:hypothetical protein
MDAQDFFAFVPGQQTTAWAAARTKNTYLDTRFHRLAAKRRSKRAIVAIGHKILVLAHYMLQHNSPFREPNHLSVDYNASASKSR